jgi:hypothetical protein
VKRSKVSGIQMVEVKYWSHIRSIIPDRLVPIVKLGAEQICFVTLKCSAKEGILHDETLNPKLNIWVLLTTIPLCERSHTHFNLVEFL